MERRLAAILVADVVGYSRIMGDDEEGTLARLKAHRDRIIDPTIGEHKGRIVKLMGDGLLAEFASVVDAVRCAVDLQEAMNESNTDVPEGQRLQLRIGINLGDVIIDGDDIYGDGVNIAARLEGLAEPGGICISSIVHESLGNRVDTSFADAGEHEVKNIARPIRVFRWPSDGIPTSPAGPSGSAASNRLSLAVSEFAPLSDETGLSHFANGLSHALVTELGKFSVFGVTRVTAANNTGNSPTKARYVLDGSVQAASKRMRVSAQLRDGETGEQVWADHFDGDIDDVLDLQDDAARRISGNLHQPLMNHAIARARSLPADRAQAYDHYLRSFYHIEKPTSSGMTEAFDACQRALEIDPAFALVYEHLAWINIHSAFNAWAQDPMVALQAAIGETVKGIGYDNKEPYLRSALGLSLVLVGRSDEGLRESEMAVRLSPADGEHVAFLAAALSFAGEIDEALKTFDEAENLSPGYHAITIFRGDALLAGGHPDQAAQCFGEIVLAIPEYSWAWANLAVCSHETNDTARAEQAIAMIHRQSPNMTVSYLESLMSFRSPELVHRMIGPLRHLGLGA